VKIKINWMNHGAPLWVVERKGTNFNGPEADALADELLLNPKDREKILNAIKDAGKSKAQTIAPNTAIQRINGLAKEIAWRNVGDSLALKAYAVALSAQAEAISRLNREPELVSAVYFDETTGLPVYSNTEADLMTFCHMFEPEPMLKAILDSFSGWSVLGIQKFEGCRCGGDLVNLELKIRLHHSHEVKDGRFVIEQLLGVESDNQAHLDKHFSGFSRKSKAQENIMVVAISKASIKLEGEYQLWVEEEKCANEIKIDQWKAILNETVARLVEAKETKEQVQ